MSPVGMGQQDPVQRCAIDAARRDTIVTVEPEPFTGSAGPMFRIPAAAGYDGTEFPIAGIPLG